jgi:hypothetical protein
MKRIVTITGVVLAAALATAPGAAAKGFIRGIRLCGPSACGSVPAPQAAIRRFGTRMLSGVSVRVASAPILPYYRVRFQPRYELPDGDTFYIPGANVICTDSGCIDVPQGLVAGMSAARADIGALTPHITSALVGTRSRADRGAFAILFNQPPARAPSTAVWKSPHTSISIEFSEVTPWSLGGASWMAYYPRYHLLSRDGRWFHAGAEVDRLVRGSTAEADAGAGRGWGIAAAAAVVLAAAAGAGRTLRRPGIG